MKKLLLYINNYFNQKGKSILLSIGILIYLVYILITHTVHTSKNESIDVGVFFICILPFLTSLWKYSMKSEGQFYYIGYYNRVIIGFISFLLIFGTLYGVITFI